MALKCVQGLLRPENQASDIWCSSRDNHRIAKGRKGETGEGWGERRGGWGGRGECEVEDVRSQPRSSGLGEFLSSPTVTTHADLASPEKFWSFPSIFSTINTYLFYPYFPNFSIIKAYWFFPSYSGPRYGTLRLDNRMRGGVNGRYWQHGASPAGHISILIEVLNALIWERKKWLMWEPQALWEGVGKLVGMWVMSFHCHLLSHHQRGVGGGDGGTGCVGGGRGGCDLLLWEANI